MQGFIHLHMKFNINFSFCVVAQCISHNHITQLFVKQVLIMAFWISKTEPMLILLGIGMKMGTMWFLILYGLPIDIGIQLTILTDDSMSTQQSRRLQMCDFWILDKNLAVVWIILLTLFRFVHVIIASVIARVICVVMSMIFFNKMFVHWKLGLKNLSRLLTPKCGRS